MSFFNRFVEGPLHVAYFNDFMVDPKIAGIEWEPVPQYDPDGKVNGLDSKQDGPQPGWYAISANHLFGYRHFESSRPVYTWLQEFQPVAMAGYSIYIFHVTIAEANELRKKLGLRPS